MPTVLQRNIEELSDTTTLEQFQEFLNEFEDYPSNAFKGGVTLASDLDRTASISFSKYLNSPRGTLIHGQKLGRLIRALNGKEFREIILYFPPGEYPKVVIAEQAKEETFIAFIEQRVVALVDLHYKVHIGPGKELFLNPTK